MLKTYPLVFTNSIHLVQQVKSDYLIYFLVILKTSHCIYFAYPAFLHLKMKATEKSSGIQQDYSTTNEHHSMHILQGIRVQHKNLLNSPFTHCEPNSVTVFVYETSTYPCRADMCILKSTLQPLIALPSSSEFHRYENKPFKHFRSISEGREVKQYFDTLRFPEQGADPAHSAFPTERQQSQFAREKENLSYSLFHAFLAHELLIVAFLFSY